MDGEGQLDVSGTESLRRALRAERTGGEPRSIDLAQADGDGHHVELYLASDTEGDPIRCVLCGTEICRPDEDWRDHVRVVENELSERLKSVGMWAAHRPEGPIALVEFFCPGCGTSLRTQVTRQGMPKPSSVELRG